MPSTLITLQLLLLAVDLAGKLHVDGRRLHADLRIDRAHFGPFGWLPDLLNCALPVRRIDASLPFWSVFNVRNAAHPNDRLPVLATVGNA